MRSIKRLKLKGVRGTEGFTLAAVVFTMLALSAVGATMTATLSNQTMKFVNDYQAQQAFYVADSGLQYVMAEYFQGDLNYSDNTAPTPSPYNTGAIDFGSGEFWVEYVAVTPTTATVRVTARVENSVRSIEQEIEQIIPLSYTFAGTNNLILGGSGTLNGDVSAGGSVNVNNGFVVNGTIYQDNDIELPEVDLASFIALTTDTDTGGTLNVAGNYTNDIYATGNVNIQNNANVTGIIVSDGNISIGQDVTLNGTLAAGGNIVSNALKDANLTWQPGPQGQVLPVLAAEGNINLTAKEAGPTPTTATITGMLIAEGNINLNKIQDSTLALNGFMFAHGTSDSSSASGEGNTIINYDSSLANSVAEDNIRIKSWKEV